MAILTQKEILEKLRARMGDDTSDETLALIEDVSDTLKDFETKTNDTTNWKKKFEDNDKAWRTKYRDRFFSAKEDDGGGEDDEDEEPQKTYTFDNLFKEEK